MQGEENLSKTQLRSALRLYTSSWRYLYGVKVGAQRVDLDGNPCGELEQQHVDHARQQLEEAKARVQAQRAEQNAKNVKPPANPPMPLRAVRAQPVKSLLHAAKAEPRRKTASRAHKLAHSPLANLVKQRKPAALCASHGYL